MEAIRQTLVFDCPAHAFYETFLNEEAQSEITNSIVEIEPAVGGSYEAFSGEVVGEFMALVPDEAIIMKWRADVPEWPEDHYAVITMQLSQSSDGTTVDFEATDVPDQFIPAVEELWDESFWQPLSGFFSW